MPTKKRNKTKYPGVVYIEGQGARGSERIYYIIYRKKGKLIEEKAGRQFQDDMTPAKAAVIRAKRIEGVEESNAERREAEKLAAETAQGKWTIARLWESYKEHTHNSKSRASDNSRYAKYIEPFFATKEPSEIVPLDLDRLRRRSLDQKAPQTTKHVLALLRRIINFGVRKQLCSGLSFQLEMPIVDNIVTEQLSPEQLKKLLKVITESTDIQASHIMLLALYTGMRKSEILRLKWNDIDFEQGFIYIRKPKGGKSQIVPLNAPASELLNNHPKLSDEYIFVNNKGMPFTEIRKRINKIRERAELPVGFRPLHGLRHVYASMLASSGKVDMYTLQKLLTHKSPVMTQRYAHLRDETLRQASNLAGDIINEIAAGQEEKSETEKLKVKDIGMRIIE
ncbi:MAG TPA: site-specific integrase [Acetivibrio sp.]|uniref:tyrosine-type recombinase/integrase n=1 Tax=Acetivibrio sp. TaxID=1872092 RepID=UPI002B6EE319|nr:site-specific integrase [Acetivibrio sp.]HOM03541.1 site-specific integrase [Acetivibrio sp.]HOT42504.1 site-specific integrase [Syntrophorhabdaceae bacterium]HQH43811.1 site-specific integrase [Syntrophorhabdaceae bacterium]